MYGGKGVSAPTSRPWEIYISGPTAGLDRDVATATFGAAAVVVKLAGHVARNPMEIPSPGNCDCPDALNPFCGHEWVCCMRKDIYVLIGCNAIFMLPNWARSRGSHVEHVIAQAMRMEIFYHSVDIPQVGGGEHRRSA